MIIHDKYVSCDRDCDFDSAWIVFNGQTPLYVGSYDRCIYYMSISIYECSLISYSDFMGVVDDKNIDTVKHDHDCSDGLTYPAYIENLY